MNLITTNSSKETILDLASEVRNFLEDRWVSWRADRFLRPSAIPSYSMCRMSSAFMRDVLVDNLGGDWKVVGGAGVEGAALGDCSMSRYPGGMLSPDGVWNGHYWVASDSLGLLVDVTADQFGHEPVIVSDNENPVYRANYLSRAMARHLGDVTKTRARWNAQWSESRADAIPAPGARI